MILRPYQISAVNGLRSAIQRGAKGVILAAPTGSGKTVMGCEVIRSAVTKRRRVLFVAHRDELIRQCSGKLTDIGIQHGIIKAGMRGGDVLAPVQVASIQTIMRRQQIPPADLLIVDECHHVMSGGYRKLIDRYPAAIRLGLTATPYRLDGQGLGEYFNEIVKAATIADLLADGFLIPPTIYAPPAPSTSGIHIRKGDYEAGESAAVFDKPQLVGEMVSTWRKRADGLTTVVFACTIEHSRHIVSQFQAAGVSAAHLDGACSSEERQQILRDVQSGVITLVSNCAVLTEGWDLPRCACVVLARPTQSRCLWRQMIGRGLRPCEGKESCVVLDHVGNIHRFGLPVEEDEFTLAGLKKDGNKPPSLKNCPQCFAVCRSLCQTCPECGHVFEKQARELPREVAGELQEFSAAPLAGITSPEARKSYYQKVAKTAREKGYKAGWAAYRFKSVFGSWPDKSWAESAV